MKKLLLTLGVTGTLFIFLFGMNKVKTYTASEKRNALPQNLPANKITNGFALVELFTSEGCSSCPSADELVTRLSKEKKDNVYILAYHVDYWNRLGWKDKFSKAEFSKRQQDYAGLLNLDGAYTPQIVVNGKVQFVGSDERKLYDVVNKVTVINAAENQISIEASMKGNKILVNCNYSKNDDATINFALVELTGSSQVKNGENAGRFLQHTNIVTDLKSLQAAANGNEISFNIPADGSFNANDYKVIVFLQRKSGEVITVNESSIKIIKG